MRMTVFIDNKRDQLVDRICHSHTFLEFRYNNNGRKEWISHMVTARGLYQNWVYIGFLSLNVFHS